MYCKYCGNNINDQSKYCPYCSNEINVNNPNLPTKTFDRNSAIICVLSAFAGLIMLLMPLYQLRIAYDYKTSIFDICFTKEIPTDVSAFTPSTYFPIADYGKDLNSARVFILVLTIIALIAMAVLYIFKYYKLSIVASVTTIVLPFIMLIAINLIWTNPMSSRQAAFGGNGNIYSVHFTFGLYVFLCISIVSLIIIINNYSKNKNVINP